MTVPQYLQTQLRLVKKKGVHRFHLGVDQPAKLFFQNNGIEFRRSVYDRTECIISVPKRG